MPISDRSIQEVKSRILIEDVVEDYVPLKKKGQNLWACCPFHDEKSPSFSVSPAKGIYKCFGCGAAGDAINFVMELEGATYLEAIKQLAQKYGVEIEETEPDEKWQEAQSEKESVHIVLNYANEYFQKNLWESDEGKRIGLSYFKERGFSKETIKAFELGYTLDKWDGLLQSALDKGYQQAILSKAGLILEKEEENKAYDRFRGRVMFPIHNLAGKAIAFGARILTNDKKQPKYINSPETLVYHKSDVLYGISQAKDEIRKQDNCYLVEGYTDVISLYQAGVKNVVASSGTSLTEGQVRLIKRFSSNVTLLYDGDAAGIKAALRGMDIILREGMNVKIVTFPDGEDPDSYSRKLGGTDFKRYVSNETKDLISFVADLYAESAAKDPNQRAEAIREVVETISHIPDPLTQEVYLETAAARMSIDLGALQKSLRGMLAEQKQRENKRKPEAAEAPTAKATEKILEFEEVGLAESIRISERMVIRVLLLYADESLADEMDVLDYLLEELEEVSFSDPVYKNIYQTICTFHEQGLLIDSDYFLKHGKPAETKVVADLISEQHAVSESWDKLHGIYIPGERDLLHKAMYLDVVRFKWRIIRKMVHENMEKIKTIEPENERELMDKLAMHQEMKQVEKKLAKILGIVIA
ncbi:MAG: DNA primase [Cyclobacteriaceae bacterium]|nr:DNA primase [Cyclobacteriaceae bacterium]MCH8515687.1 DNA primase [Cyclobacteriaceae bacterium]